MANRKIDVSVSGGEIYTKLTAERDLLRRQLKTAMEAVEHYADEGRWSLVAVPEFSCSKYLRYEYFESHGFGFARKVRDEIEGMK